MFVQPETLPTPEHAFVALDWIVLVGYLLVLLCASILLTRKQENTEDYFLGGRRMPVWAVAISVLATSLSAATFIGAPQQSFVGNLTYLSANIGAVLGAVFVAIFFLPVFYARGVTTVYELLEERFGTTGRLSASFTFMIGRVFASGARIYIAALPASMIIFGDIATNHLMMAIGVLVAAGIFFTLYGGISAVIWTDVLQTCVFVGAAVVGIWILLDRIPANMGEILGALAQPSGGGESKLAIIDFSLDPSSNYTLWTALFGFTLFNMAAYGADQDLVQRMLTCKSAARGSMSVIGAILVGLPVTFIFMAIGLLLYVFYSCPGLMGSAAPTYAISDSRGVFLEFILSEMPPGLTGLLVAGLFAVGVSSLNSALNAMGSTFISDFYMKFVRDRSDQHYLKASRIAVLAWGLILGGFASICVVWQRASGQTLIDFALSVMTFAYSGLLAVFLVAIFSKRGSSRSAVAALITGFAVTFLLQPHILQWLGGESAIASLTLAFPWRMLIATGLSVLVCMAGRRA